MQKKDLKIGQIFIEENTKRTFILRGLHTEIAGTLYWLIESVVEGKSTKLSFSENYILNSCTLITLNRPKENNLLDQVL